MTIAGLKFHSRRLWSEFLWKTGVFHKIYKPKVDRGIIMYHGIDKSSSREFNLRFCGHKDLYRQLLYFKKNFKIVSLEEMFKNELDVDKKFKLAITFDDGYENWYTYAYPIIKKLDIPVTFFISRPKDVNYLWLDVIDIYVASCSRPIEVDQYFFEKELNQYVDKRSEINLKTWLELQTDLSKFYQVKELFEQELNRDYESFDPVYWKLLNEEQIKEVSQSELIEIGSHCISHIPLTNLNKTQIESELYDSKIILEELIGEKVNSIAYPIGMYNAEILDVAEEIGYKNQLAVNYKLHSDVKDYRVLPRVGVYSDYSSEEQVRRFINEVS